MLSSRLWSTFVLVLAVSLTACGGDDDGPTNPGGGGGDTTAPLVLSVDPSDGSVAVPTDQQITVVFNEAMDPASDDGAITLSHGNTNVSGTWTDSRTLVIAHDPFPEGTEVTLTLGTGFADEAGNNLASAFVVAFYTQSSTLTLLESDPADGAKDVDRNATIALKFSEAMNLSTLDGFITLDDGTITITPVQFSLSEGENDEVLVDPTATLPESATITVTVRQGAQALSGKTLAAAVSISFETGVTADTTPPTLVGITPSSGSVIPTNTSSFVLQFSEAIDQDSLNPSTLSAQFALLLQDFDLEPTWSADGTTLTVPLPTPLPEGLPFVVVCGPFLERAGNASTEGFDYRVTVEGTADPWPFSDGIVQYWAGSATETSGGQTQEYDFVDAVRYEEQPSGDFRVVSYSPDFTEAYNYELFAVDANSVDLKGFADTDETGAWLPMVALNPAVPFLQKPVALDAMWNGTSTASFDGETITIDWSFEVVAQSDMPAEIFGGQSGPGFEEQLIWADVWAVVLDYEFRAGTDLVQTGRDSIYYAPGVGRVREWNRETDVTTSDVRTELGVLTGIDLGVQ